MIKKITDLVESQELKKEDVMPFVDYANGETKKVQIENLLKAIIPKNAGAHNSIYRGKDITNLFYDGTLSQQIAAQTFDDIFIGDYVVGKVSKRKYLVADINYRLHCGDNQCTTPHILMISERIIGIAKMNDTDVTTGAYIGSKMYTEYLAPFKTVIQNDFEASHIVQHRNYFANVVADGYESARAWFDSDIELMNELMVYGGEIYHNKIGGTNFSSSTTTDKSQLSLFRLDKSKIVARNDNGGRQTWWLRDVISTSNFARVSNGGTAK